MTASTSDTCIVSGDLRLISDGKLAFSQLNTTDTVAEGEKIVTSNISDKYLRGILIGNVSEITEDSNHQTKKGYIIPVVDFQHIQEVLVEKIRIKIKGYEHATVDAAAAKIVEAAKRSGSNVSGPIPLPTDKEIITILRATHKYKDSREQFEMRTHKRLIDVIRQTQKTTEALQKLEIPAGVDIVMELK